jgi:anti-anti-sigma regulatory factor
MDGTSDDCRLTELDVAGWYVVVVDGSLATTSCGELEACVRPRLTRDSSVAVDLRGTVADSEAVLASLRALVAAATEAGAVLALVSGSAAVRDQLAAAGLPTAYESLDAAAGERGKVLRQAGAPDEEPPLHSAAGDALLP